MNIAKKWRILLIRNQIWRPCHSDLLIINICKIYDKPDQSLFLNYQLLWFYIICNMNIHWIPIFVVVSELIYEIRIIVLKFTYPWNCDLHSIHENWSMPMSIGETTVFRLLKKMMEDIKFLKALFKTFCLWYALNY